MNSATVTAPIATPAKASAHAVSGTYYLAIGYLRAFITLLVVAHHAVLAYHPYAPPPAVSLVSTPMWQIFPVVDAHKWMGWSFFVGFNDIFFMSLMFFLSGLFVYHSIERKGVGLFLRDRLSRLGLPFVVAAAVIAPLAYYPSYLQSASHGGFLGFWQQWRHLGNWPAGPAWFVWVLLAFDAVAALLFAFAPKLIAWLAQVVSGAPQRPLRLFLLVAGVSALTYVPLALHFTAERWSTFGPFAFQTSRLLHYFAYFLIAIGVGAIAISHGLFASDGKLARRWPLWTIAMVLAYFALAAAFVTMISGVGKALPWGPLLGILWVLSCAVSCFGFMSLFARFAIRRRAVFDSLTDNAYGIYLIHYAFVSWLQYALLPASLSGFVKGVLAAFGAILLSWATTAALRRIPALARVI